MIAVNNLSVNYDAKKALDEVNLLFETGKAYGIVGANGAGKTTLFNCLAGLVEFSGDIRSAYTPLKNILGYLPTEPYFFPKMTGKEYLTLLCKARALPLPDFDSKNIFELPLQQFATTYSTGMKKKLAIFGVLLQQNEVFILDEPFNGVDIQSSMLIAEVIHKLKSLGKTLLISSHIFSTLSDTCDEIYLLEDGKVAKHVLKAQFPALENEMKDFLIGNSLDRLGL